MIDWQGLACRHVETSARDLSSVQGIHKRLFVDQTAARGVDEERMGYILANSALPIRLRVEGSSGQ